MKMPQSADINYRKWNRTPQFITGRVYYSHPLYRVYNLVARITRVADIIKPAVTHTAVPRHELRLHCRLMMHRKPAGYAN